MAVSGLGDKRGSEDPVLSLQDVLEEDDALEDEACAVLGGSDSERCSYPEGYVKRQALYACNTCSLEKDEPAGICLACTYKCHEGHDLFELYTKRNFRCDCGNSKFKELECRLCPEKESCNSANKYNQNFFGVYCVCKRPYPDPEDETPDEMIQCIVCEDWFHGRHLGALPPESVEYQEMVCPACMERCSFLWTYVRKIGVPAHTQVSQAAVDHVDSVVDDGPAMKVDGERSSSGPSASACDKKCVNGEVSGVKLSTTCKLKKYRTHPAPTTNTATYWPSNWRGNLCRCETCEIMYAELEVSFLLEECDTVQAYEHKGKSEETEESRDPLMTALSTMNRVQQVELISEYNDLKVELKDYLKRFAEEGKVVQTEDIQQFFTDLRSRKRRRLTGVQYYCS